MTGRTDDEGQIDDELRSGDIGQDVQQPAADQPDELEEPDEIFEVRGDTTGADPDGIDPVVIRPHEPGHLT